MNRINGRADRAISSVFALVAGSMMACGSSTIESFDVEPRRLCAGDSVRIRWQATDDARLTSEPDLPVLPTTADSDTLRVALDKRTLFRLNVLDADDYAEQSVLVYSLIELDTLGGPSSAVGDSVLTTRFDVPRDKYADVLRIESATNLSGRPLTVRHDGEEVVLSADTMPSRALDGWGVGGSWDFRGPLVGGEVMGDPDHAPPAHLWIRVRLTCDQDGGS